MTQKVSLDNFSAGAAGKQINVGLLGFKMAVNDSITVYNLVDGVVDEFHSEDGTDEGEGSNDLYNTDCDFYINSTTPTGGTQPYSAGFTTTAITEPDTSVTGTNPGYGCGTFATFTVPSGVTSVAIQAWGAAGGSSMHPQGTEFDGGGGGYAEGTLAVTASQVLDVVVGEGGFAGRYHDTGFRKASLGGGGDLPATQNPEPDGHHGAGGGFAGVVNAATAEISQPQLASCQPGTRGTYPSAGVIVVAGGGGGSGNSYQNSTSEGGHGGGGGGLVGAAGGTITGQTNNCGPGPGPAHGSGGGGDQEQGGQGGSKHPQAGEPGGLLYGGAAHEAGLTQPASDDTPAYSGSGGGGYYGGGGGSACFSPTSSLPSGSSGAGGGGSSYYGHPQITSGSTEASYNCAAIGDVGESGGNTQPGYVSEVGAVEAVASIPQYGTTQSDPSSHQGGDGYVLLTASAPASTTSTNIVSNAFTAGSAPSTARIVVFQENVATPTLNTDIIAYVSRDGGSNFTQATLADEGYITGSSGQRILAGSATISGQPSGTSMRWKLALANNAVKIHGVSLSWA